MMMYLRAQLIAIIQPDQCFTFIRRASMETFEKYQLFEFAFQKIPFSEAF